MADGLRMGLALRLSLLAVTSLVTACANPREDVRVTLCKDLVAVTHVGASPALKLQGTETEIRGREYAAVRVRYATGTSEGQAVCYYRHDAPEETAMTLSDPLSAFAASPYQVTFGSEPLSNAALAEAIKKAMLKQGGELVDRAKELADRAKKGMQ